MPGRFGQGQDRGAGGGAPVPSGNGPGTNGGESVTSGKPARVETRPYYAEKGLSAAFYDLTTAADRGLDGDIDLYAALESSEIRQRVRLRRGDMAALNLGETFDAVIAPYFAPASLGMNPDYLFRRPA